MITKNVIVVYKIGIKKGILGYLICIYICVFINILFLFVCLHSSLCVNVIYEMKFHCIPFHVRSYYPGGINCDKY